MASLAINGKRKSGQEIRDENVTAIVAVANIVKNSLGPAGLDKMLVDDLGEVNITNDGATILKLIDVKHPAAKILVDLSRLQDEEVGDGTTSVVLMAAELVRRGNDLIKKSFHPTTVISGFQQARREACKFIAENMSYKVDSLGDDTLINAAKTTLSSKVIGKASSHFASLAVKAMESIARPSLKQSCGKKYNIQDISVLKLRGDRMEDSYLVDGVAIYNNRPLHSLAMPSSIFNAKIAMIDFDLRKEKLSFNVKVACEQPQELQSMRDQEILAVKNRIECILKVGVNVIVSSKIIEDFAMNFIADRGAIAIKNVARNDLKRICKAVGGRVLTSLVNIDAKDFEEKMETDAIGHSPIVREERIDDIANLIIFQTSSKNKKLEQCAKTMIIRGPNEYSLDEIDRSLHDVFCSLKRVMESSRVVVGGGVVEAALSVYLESFAESIGSREQMAIAEFASSMLIIPKTLATNGAHDVIDLIAALRAAHNSVLRDKNSQYKDYGLDLEKGEWRDNLKEGVLEPAMGKIKAIKFATEAAITILRIDDAVEMAPKVEKASNRGR